MNDDGAEGFVFLGSLFMMLVWGTKYYRGLCYTARMGCPRGQRWPLFLMPPLALGLLCLILLRFAAVEVRAGGYYLAAFMVLGAAWMWSSHVFCGWLGVGFQNDALENHNPAAVIALSGAMLGTMLAYAGGNIGEGDTIWSTIVASALATAGLMLAWLLLNCLAAISASVADERDIAAGWRLAGFLVASGLILGRAVAGDWDSLTGTLTDFGRFGWPEIILLGAATVAEWVWRPGINRPPACVKTNGILPAAFYLVIAGVVLLAEGWWK